MKNGIKKYKSITGLDKRIALPEGHIAIVGADWCELPDIYRDEALRQGCVDEDMAAGIIETANVDRPAEIEKAINAMLDSDEEGDFNADNSPNRNKVKKLCGFSVTKEEIVATWKKMVKGPDED